MLRLLEDEVAEELSKREGDDRHRHVTIATGKAAAPSLKKHMQKIREKYPNVQAEVVTIINYFFGESITVSGLITGKDLMEQLEGRDLGDCLLLPCNMLRSGKNVFLDDVTVEEVEERLKTPVQIIDCLLYTSILTLFPEMIEQGLHTSILGRAINNGYISLETTNIRDFSANKFNRVDDYRCV